MDIETRDALISLGSKLRQLRAKKGWTLREMATHCNIDFSNIGQMEKGRVDVRFSTIIQLAKVLGVTPCELFDC